MARLWISNIPPDTTEAELKDLLTKYGGAEFTGMESVPGDGTSPAAILSYGENMPAGALQPMADRLNGLNWKGRALTVQVIH